MNVSLAVSEPEYTRTVGVATRNRFCGAPVELARERLPGGTIRSILVNNRVANVAAPGGLDDARLLARESSRLFDIPEEHALSISTGVIGWRLPVASIREGVSRLAESEVGPVEFAEAIMTTDRYPKAAWRRSRKGATLLGVAKGAGMIEPHLATMLGFVMFDGRVEGAMLDTVFRRVVDGTFNTISVDGDQSTSDMVLLSANGASDIAVSEAELEDLLWPVCDELARDIVRNGEGTSHVIEATVRGVEERDRALKIAKHVVDAPLVKTAIFGNDPNVGRILAAVGDALDLWDDDRRVDIRHLRISIADTEVFSDGAFRLDEGVERNLAARLRACAMGPATRGYPQHRESVSIVIDFSAPGAPDSGEVVAIGSDLSYEYVKENADYRT